MTAPLLSARDISREYGSGTALRRALDGVSLDLRPGELVAIMGPSGCGKSTLLHILGGLERPTSGEVWLDGQRVDRLSEGKWARIRRTRISYVFQFFNLVGNLPVASNVELPGLMAGMPGAEVTRRRRELFDELGLTGMEGSLPAQLSGGQQQRVALARALITRPEILLADEPTGNLDSAATADVLDLIRRYHDQGQTTLLVTHDARVAATAQRVVRMRDGRIVSDAPVEAEPARRALSRFVELEA